MERRGAVAHRSEQAAHNHLVDGSTPSSPTNELILVEKNSLLSSFCYDSSMSYEDIPVDEQTRLVQLQPDQADKLFELTDKNRDYLGEFLPWPPFVNVVEDSRKHIEETLEKRAQDVAYTYGIEYEGEIVGDISLRNLNDTEKTPEIGYWISPNFAGKGLTTKSVQALTDLGLSSLGLGKIVIRANPDNGASNKVAEKAGYTQVGTEIDNDEPLNVWAIER